MQVSLFDNENNIFTDASVTRMTPSHLQMAKSSWAAGFRRREALRLADGDGLIWSCGDVPGGPASPLPNGYVVIHAGRVQGMMLFRDELCPSRKRPGTWLLYVSYLATAPWNREGHDRPCRFRNVGRNLVVQAVRQSIELGCPGRLGLHSYPTSAGFYERLGFDNLGSDAARRGMTYFELLSGAAYHLLSSSGAHEDVLADLL